MLPNISRSKRNQTMKFFHVIKYNKRKTFLQKSRGKLRKKTSFRPLFFFLKTLFIRSKQVVSHLSFDMFW